MIGQLDKLDYSGHAVGCLCAVCRAQSHGQRREYVAFQRLC